MMVKLADTPAGKVAGQNIDKQLNRQDQEKLAQGIELCKEIFSRLGVPKEETFLGTINAGHPGGMLPLTRAQAATLHSDQLADNLYLADATLFPHSLGNPPSLTIMALAKRIAKLCLQNQLA